MRLEDVKIDQVLEDIYGNKYRVLEIDDDNFLPVHVECIEFQAKVHFGAGYNVISGIGSRAWVLKDFSRLLIVDGTVGAFLQRHFYPNSNWDFDDLEYITVSSNDTDKRFLIGNSEAIRKVRVTLGELRIFDNSSYPTRYSTRLDDILVDKSGKEYRVIGRNNEGLTVKYKNEVIGANGIIFDTYSTMYIPFPDDRYQNKSLTAKEFVKKNRYKHPEL